MSVTINSPFKFLDAYEKGDAKQFFGRDREIKDLYNFVNMNKLVMVYGQSGTGKTSLVQCGLASKFDVTDWFPIWIRRRENINESIENELLKIDQTLKRKIGENAPDLYITGDVTGTLRKMNDFLLRPIYLIFDQFEELLILGNERKEQVPFILMLLRLLKASDLNLKIILVLREEYIAQLYKFEKYIPTLFDRRLRVERMNRSNVQKVILGNCKEFNITLEKPKNNVNQIIDAISSERSGISLPYLQVYLDLFYREDFARTYPGESTNGKLPPLEFTTKEIEDFGNIENVLNKFLTQQINDLKATLITQKDPILKEIGLQVKAEEQRLQPFKHLEDSMDSLYKKSKQLLDEKD